jgi:NADPH:quinone reductase-like Zn-dependent oxidoreductase
VLGASGGLGRIAVQILKGWRCHVTGVCSSAAIDQLGNQLPVDRLFAYDTNADQLNQLRNEFDVILDYRPAGAFPELACLHALRSTFGSCYVTASSPVLRHLDQDGMVLGSVRVAFDLIGLHLSAAQTGRQVRWAFYRPDRNALAQIAKLVDKQVLQAPIDHVVDFEDVPNAYQTAASGHSRGRIVIRHQT